MFSSLELAAIVTDTTHVLTSVSLDEKQKKTRESIVEKITSHNKQSVKFPNLEEVVESTELNYRNPDHEQVLSVVKEVYEFIAGKITLL